MPCVTYRERLHGMVAGQHVAKVDKAVFWLNGQDWGNTAALQANGDLYVQ